MNFLFLSTWYLLPADNGSKIRVLNLLRSVSERHDVTFVSFAFGTAVLDDADELHQICNEVHVIQLNPIELSQRGTLSTFLSLMPNSARHLPQMLNLVQVLVTTCQFDAVIASTMTMSQYALEFEGLKIIEEHNSLSRWMYDRFRDQTSPLQRVRCWVSWKKACWAEARLYSHFDLVTVVSSEDYQAISAGAALHREKIAVIPNGTERIPNKPDGIQSMPFHLVFNGSLSYAPNFEAMVWFLKEIYPKIQRNCPDVMLSITGSYNGVNLKALPSKPGVRLTGHVEDIKKEVASAAACVVPIRQGGGTRLKILEAMAVGTPVVTTSKGAEGLDVIQGKHLLVADDPTTFSALTIKLMKNPALREFLATNARNLVVEHYDWQKIGRSFVKLVEGTVEQSRI